MSRPSDRAIAALFEAVCTQTGMAKMALMRHPADPTAAREALDKISDALDAYQAERRARELDASGPQGAEAKCGVCYDSPHIASCGACGGGKDARPPGESAPGFVLVPMDWLETVFGMAREGCNAPGAAYRWCERIDELFFAPTAALDYAEWKQPIPRAMLAAAPAAAQENAP